jgi:hypothetical protein
MEFEPKTISEHIECLARMTGAPDSFVDQVRTLFSSKGISLEDDATPYVSALDEAFTREECIRSTTYRAHKSVVKLQSDFSRIGKAYVEQMKQTRRTQSGMRELSKKARELSAGKRTHVVISGDHRTYVTRPQRDTFPMVPGPKEPQ